MSIGKRAAVVTAFLALTGSAQAALFNRGGGMIYDSTLNITWLSDWNYAKTSGYHPTGEMTWAAALTWANNLVYGGYDDWRLPTSLNTNGSGPCVGERCLGSEMGHMFYADWGASAGQDFSTGMNVTNLALFGNVQSNGYWSGTEFTPNQNYAWYFGTFDGFQTTGLKSTTAFAISVRSGDVAVVPEAPSYALLLLGIGVGVVTRSAKRLTK
jgi:hypothetical protein